MTARAMVGTATNWKSRVKTLAMKLNKAFRVGIFIQPKMPPSTRATIHKTN